jgi:quinate/shikimate dehydrogenase
MNDGNTALYGVLGHPIHHSFSPAIHTAAFEAENLNATYVAFDVAEDQLEKAVEGLVTLDVKGWNLTMPHKTKMCGLCDELSEAASIVGAVNTVVNDHGRLTGHITDGAGFTAMLRDRGFDVKGKRVVLFGAGGAARAVAVQLALDGAAALSIFNRTLSKAQKLADLISERTACKAGAFALADAGALNEKTRGADLLVNGTKLGMAPDEDTCVLENPDLLDHHPVMADFVYHPLMTRFLKMGKEADCQVFDGLGMLLWQGALAFKLWTGHDMPVDTVREKVFGR